MLFDLKRVFEIIDKKYRGNESGATFQRIFITFGGNALLWLCCLSVPRNVPVGSVSK